MHLHVILEYLSSFIIMLQNPDTVPGSIIPLKIPKKYMADFASGSSFPHF